MGAAELEPSGERLGLSAPELAREFVPRCYAHRDGVAGSKDWFW